MKLGHKKISISTVNTNVVILVIVAALRLCHTEVWYREAFLADSSTQSCRCSGSRCIALSMSHGLLCPFFGNRGKRTAWNTQKAFNEVTPAFCALAAALEHRAMATSNDPLERFMVLLYDRMSSLQQEQLTRLGASSMQMGGGGGE